MLVSGVDFDLEFRPRNLTFQMQISMQINQALRFCL